MFFDSVGALTSLLSTYFFIRLNNKAWPVSLLAICLNGYLYWQKGIYADMTLEVFYFFSTCYGWYLWNRPSTHPQHFLIAKLSLKQWLLLLLIISFIYLLLVKSLLAFTHSNVAVLDALTTSLSLAAQWLMCHKIMATWILWLFTDLIYAYMYLYKALPFHTLLMLIYTVMAAIGYLRWGRLNKKESYKTFSSCEA